MSGVCVCMGEGGVGGLSHDHHSHTRSVLLVGAVLVDPVVSADEERVCVSGVCNLLKGVREGRGMGGRRWWSFEHCCWWGLCWLTLWCLLMRREFVCLVCVCVEGCTRGEGVGERGKGVVEP